MEECCLKRHAPLTHIQQQKTVITKTRALSDNHKRNIDLAQGQSLTKDLHMLRSFKQKLQT